MDSSKPYLLFICLIIALASCGPAENPPGQEAPPPTSAPQPPIEPSSTTEPESAPQAIEAPITSAWEIPPQAPSAAEKPLPNTAGTVAPALDNKPAAPVKRDAPQTEERLLAKNDWQAGQEEPEKKTRNIDITGRTLKQLGALGINLSPQQEEKLKALSDNYDFNTIPSGEERRALRRKFMTDVFDSVLTEEQQETVREKRGFGEGG